jgi:hypothetical protein
MSQLGGAGSESRRCGARARAALCSRQSVLLTALCAGTEVMEAV